MRVKDNWPVLAAIGAFAVSVIVLAMIVGTLDTATLRAFLDKPVSALTVGEATFMAFVVMWFTRGK